MNPKRDEDFQNSVFGDDPVLAHQRRKKFWKSIGLMCLWIFMPFTAFFELQKLFEKREPPDPPPSPPAPTDSIEPKT